MKSLCVLVMGLVALQTPAQPDMSATIEGNVTLYSTTEAIPKVQITLSSANNGAVRASTVTDAWGHFIVKDVPAGAYYVNAKRAGFSAPARDGMPVPDSSQRTVSVAPQQRLDHADLTLVRGGVITGRVLDGNGRPAPRLQVEARSVGAGGTIATFASGTVDTNDKGEYRIFDLQSGHYIVSVEDLQRGAAVASPLASWVKTFFPGVITIAKASAIDVDEGSVVTATDFAMQSSAKFTISGVVTVPLADTTGLGLSGIYLVPSGADSASIERQLPRLAENVAPQRATAGNMRFEIRAVPESYELYAVVLDRRSRTGFAGRTLVQVNQQDVKDIVVDTSGAAVTGRLQVTGRGAGPPGLLAVRIVPVDFPSIAGIGLNPAVPDASGNFTVSNIPDGKWGIYITNVPADITIADIRQGATSISSRDVRVAERAAEPIQIIYSPSGSIDGFVRDADQKPIAAMRVVAYPYDQPPAAESHQTTTDAAGHFVLTGLAPGEHALFAVPSSLISTLPGGQEAFDIKPALTPYQSQGAIAKVNSGVISNVVLAPLKLNASPPR